MKLKALLSRCADDAKRFAACEESAHGHVWAYLYTEDISWGRARGNPPKYRAAWQCIHCGLGQQ